MEAQNHAPQWPDASQRTRLIPAARGRRPVRAAGRGGAGEEAQVELTSAGCWPPPSAPPAGTRRPGLPWSAPPGQLLPAPACGGWPGPGRAEQQPDTCGEAGPSVSHAPCCCSPAPPHLYGLWRRLRTCRACRLWNQAGSRAVSWLWDRSRSSRFSRGWKASWWIRTSLFPAGQPRIRSLSGSAPPHPRWPHPGDSGPSDAGVLPGRPSSPRRCG